MISGERHCCQEKANVSTTTISKTLQQTQMDKKKTEGSPKYTGAHRFKDSDEDAHVAETFVF